MKEDAMMKRGTLLWALFLVAASQAARAGTINLATGLNASNHLITTGGLADAHWTVQEQAGGIGAAQTVYPNNADWGVGPGGWAANGPNSTWIARDANTTNNGPAPYTFYRTFNLSGANLANVSVSGSWAIDDAGTLDLNGHQIAALSTLQWVSLTPFSVAEGSPFLNQGLNTLSITITYDDQYLDGVRLQGFVKNTAAPEPSSLVLAGLGALTLLGAAWHHRGRVG
jgi:PEP-CTERM motif